jgi:hypothetical protein
MALPTFGTAHNTTSTTGSAGTSTASNTATGSITVRYPATVNNGDIAFLLGFTRDSANVDLSAPALWTAFAAATTQDVTGSVDLSSRMFWRRCDGSEGGTTLTLVTNTSSSTSHLKFGTIFTVSNAIASGTPYEDYDATTSTAATIDSPTTTTTDVDRLAIRVFVGGGVTAQTSAPSGWTRPLAIGTSVGNDAEVSVDWKELSSATTEAATTHDSNTTHAAIAYAFAVLPVPTSSSETTVTPNPAALSV